MASTQAACCTDSSIGRATLNQQLNPQWPMLTGRARMSASRLASPGGELATERGLSAARGGDYFQRLRDAALQEQIVNAGNALLQRVRSSSVRGHFGRCGSGWTNVNSYRDYSGHHFLFVDGQARERDELFRSVKQRYVRSYTQPETADIATEVPYRTHAYAATARPNLDLYWTRAHALNHQHEHRPYEVEQAQGGASSIDVTRILSAALRPDAQRGASRYSWNREDVL